LWHVITYDDFSHTENNPETKKFETVLFDKQTGDLKKRLATNNETKMVIYNALPCNSQVKDNKIDLLFQQYEKFVIPEEESIDNAFASFNIIVTCLKALDEGYSSNNYVRKFLRALHPKWRAKFTTIEESKDLTSLSLDELIEDLKVQEVRIKKDSKIVKGKREQSISLVLKAKKESSNEEILTFSVVKTNKCGDPNHLIRECLKPPRNKNQRDFVGGSLSDMGEEEEKKTKDEMDALSTCLIAQESNEICLGSDLEPNKWIKDNGCTNHVTSNQKLFSTYKAYNEEPKNLSEALKDESWVVAMQEELNQFTVNDVWELVPNPKSMTVIGTKLEDPKPMKTPMSSDTKVMKDEEGESVDNTKYRGMIGSTHLGLWYLEGSCIETIVYADSDHAGDYVDRKSTSGICTFMRYCLTTWFSKKQTALAISTTEAEYVSTEKAGQ
ncbi:hypothetical protein Tco_1096987, partial [Tanacetum coccineum]